MRKKKILSFISYLAVIKTFIDRIIKRLQHFKRSFDNGLSTRSPSILLDFVFFLFKCMCMPSWIEYLT
jgi:hypothetical protein